MAVTAAQALSSFSGYLNRREAEPIFQRAARTSVVQRLARQVPMSWRGESIPVFGSFSAGWVGEAGQKPSTAMPVTVKQITPSKLAVMIPVSQEVVRANPANFMTYVRREVGNAFGRAFDLATLYDQGGDGTAGAGPFATFLAQTTKTVELDTTGADDNIRPSLIAALKLLVDDGKHANGWAFDSRVEPLLLGSTDANQRPIWTEMELKDVPEAELQGAVRRSIVLNRSAWMGDGIYSGAATDFVGFLGDWSEAAWGVVSGINYSVSAEASVTIDGGLVSAFENNLFILRAEAEYGFLANDVAAFVKLTDATTEA